MIERFNFYDVYGYFIPGALLIAVLWFPYALVTGVPSADLAEAAVWIVAAYVAGHVLQIVASKILTSSKRAGDRYRAPSDLLLNPATSTFSNDFREKVAAKIKASFDLDVSVEKNRGLAFFLCRNRVIGSKTASYVEQFEGMYALMRGISAAAAVGCAYDIGWALGPLLSDEGRWGVAFLLILAAIGIGADASRELRAEDRDDRVAAGALLFFAVICAGALISYGDLDPFVLLGTAVVSTLVSLWTFGSYHAFTRHWTQAVYQQFYLLEKPAEEKVT